MVDWYKAMAGMGEESGGISLGVMRIGRKLAIGSVALLVALFLVHQVRLAMGLVSWFGMTETNIGAAPDWMHTPASTNLRRDDYGLGVPMLAVRGQEIVVRYRLSSTGEAASAPRARVLVSCWCAVGNWQHLRIEGPGQGELVVPIRSGGLYSVQVAGQSAGANGRASVGSYRWGLRTRD
jgi:hypothetical protein